MCGGRPLTLANDEILHWRHPLSFGAHEERLAPGLLESRRALRPQHVRHRLCVSCLTKNEHGFVSVLSTHLSGNPSTFFGVRSGHAEGTAAPARWTKKSVSGDCTSAEGKC